MSQPSPPDDALVAFALELADTARAVILPSFRAGGDQSDKADGSPVTVADRAGERALRHSVAQTYPEHGFIGEEFGSDRPEAEYVWAVDPIDGTKAFITGKPAFGTLIALAHRGRPVLGIIDMPALSERWLGVQGRPTRHIDRAGERVVRCRPCASPAAAVLLTTAPDLYEGRKAKGFDRLRRATKLTLYGGDCHNYGLLASGFCDLVSDVGMGYDDVAALVPVVEGAGGRITDWSGQALQSGGDGTVLAAGDPSLHQAALDVLRGWSGTKKG